MRAVRVTSPTGPSAVTIDEIEEPGETGPFGPQVLVEAHAVGVSFPDLLLSKGEYQLKPDPPFVLGVDYAGVVRSAPEDSGLSAGQRVAGVLPYGAAADVVASGPDSVFMLPDSVDFTSAAAIPMNYLTCQFALQHRAELRRDETVLIHGAAGGVGTAAIQVARGLGARTIAVVSSEQKAEFAKRAGADETVVLAESFLSQVRELTDGRGVDVVVDVVGGSLFTDSLRALAPLGRLLVIGFAAGDIPQVKVNRLLLNNIDVRGVGWGAYAMSRPGFMQQQWQALLPMIESGAIAPPIGATYPMQEFGRALAEMEDRKTLGKSVVLLR